MAKGKTGVLIVNLGTPDHYTVPHVRKYLREFLMDDRVIDIPYLKRWLLVNLIIAPFRAPKSSGIYKKLWTEQGSPLLYYGREVEKKLQLALGDEFIVKLGMRYQNPGIKKALFELVDHNVNSIVVFPLFPQYASATTGSIHQKVMEVVKNWGNMPDIKFINGFCDYNPFIKAFSQIARQTLNDKEFDLMLFSYHGLPEHQILKASVDNVCNFGDCSRLLAMELEIPVNKYQIVFQSRLGKSPWIQPYAEEVIRSLPEKGMKKVAVMMPSFVADCLETTVEVGMEFKDIFMRAGGKEWIFVESLNDSQQWIATIKTLILGSC
jgi:ferrochelatase